ncbi:MAG: hypothetical protein ACLTZI_09645 [[Eubacterium] siraeum]
MLNRRRVEVTAAVLSNTDEDTQGYNKRQYHEAQRSTPMKCAGFLTELQGISTTSML